MNYRSSLSERVFSEIKRRKEQAEQDFFEREQKLKSDETLCEFDRAISKYNRLIGYAKADCDIDTANKLIDERSAVERNRANYLAEKGIEIISEPNYFCKKCSDVGFTEKGYCDCFRSLYLKTCLTELGVSQKQLKTFKDDLLSEKYQLGEIYASFKAMLAEDKPLGCYLFTGYCGSGKTFLAECVASESLSRGKDVLFLTSFELNNLFLTYHTSPVEEKNIYFSALSDCDLLCIDDLGAEPIFNKVTVQYLFLLLSERKKNDKPFIITTNLTLKELLARYGERVFSRLVQEGNTLCIDFGKQNLRTKK